MESAPVIIRPTIPDDHAAIASLINRYIRATTVHFGFREETPDDVARARRAAAEHYPWLTGLDRATEKFLGFARAAPWRTRDAYAHTAEVALYVHDHAHRRGVGRALYTQLLDQLAARDFHAAIAGVTLPNDPSVAFHRALGFEEVGRFREVGRKFNAWHDVLFLQRMLG
jgi:L-amino acid N-acyltransferase YncA